MRILHNTLIVGDSHLPPCGHALYSVAMPSIVKDSHFELITEIIKPDAKRRVSLGGAMTEAGIAYNVYRNRLGQVVLDPVKTIPAYESWLFENKTASASVKRGLADSAAGRTKKRGSFAAYAD